MNIKCILANNSGLFVKDIVKPLAIQLSCFNCIRC